MKTGFLIGGGAVILGIVIVCLVAAVQGDDYQVIMSQKKATLMIGVAVGAVAEKYVEDEDQIATIAGQVITELGIDGIEIAPGKFLLGMNRVAILGGITPDSSLTFERVARNYACLRRNALPHNEAVQKNLEEVEKIIAIEYEKSWNEK